MNDREFELLDRIEADHWWFVGKRKLLHAVLERSAGDGPAAPEDARGGWLLDLGCGTGGVLRELMAGRRCLGMDRSRLALQVATRKGFARLVRGDLGALPFPAAAFSSVLLLDVIEHLDDDVGFLRRVREVCRPGARVVIGVPAFQLLWSQHDVTFEHRRRYSRRDLDAAVRRAGFRVERMTYSHCLVFPVAATWRLLSQRLGLGRFAPGTDFWPLPRWLNALLARVYDLEAWLLRRVDLPVGVSLLCVVRPPDEAPGPADQTVSPRASPRG